MAEGAISSPVQGSPNTTTTAREADAESQRELTRRRIAYILIGTLVIVILGAFAYVIWMSIMAGEVTTDTLVTVLQTLGTTLLAPLIGLIGAVIGFYFGGQAAVQGAHAANQSTQTATQASRAVTQAASELATQIVGEQPRQQNPEQQQGNT
jgi:hypothetical protein